MVYLLILIPTIAGGAALLIKQHEPRRWLLVLTALAHFALTLGAWTRVKQASPQDWLTFDEPGLVFLSITSALALVASVYGVGYLRREMQGMRRDFEEGVFFANAPEAVFTGCLLLFLATQTFVCLSHHFGLLWVAIEATTLASAPLIYFHRHHRSLEATWKYLLICSVGIALALLGNFFLAVAASPNDGQDAPMVLGLLLQRAPHFDQRWLKAALVLLLVGYGTKMGLAPLHTWLPDAHSEAPSVVSALLSGSLLNCAFLGILRAQQVCAAAGIAAFGRDLLVMFGLVSMAFAAIFIVGQSDFKRLLAYSSVEHMGILAFGMGVGGVATFGAMLHAVNHSLTKAMLFLVAGNILTVFKTKAASEVRGLLKIMPVSGVLWVLGFFAITGTPPFGLFLSELTILKGVIDQGRGWLAIGFAFLLLLIFVGMAAVCLRMAQGAASEPIRRAAPRESWLAISPPIVLAILVVLLGFHVPDGVSLALERAALILGKS